MKIRWISFKWGRLIERLRHLNLRTRLMIYLSLLMIVSLSVFYYSFYRNYNRFIINQNQVNAQKNIQTLTKNVQLILDATLNVSLDIYGNYYLNDLIKKLNGFDTTDYNSLYAINGQLWSYLQNHDQVQSIRLFTPSYHVNAINKYSNMSESELPNEWNTDIKAADGKIVVLPTRKLTYYENNNDVSTDMEILSFARVVKNLGEIYKNESMGILVIDFRESYIEQLFDTSKLSDNSFTVLLREDGTILSSNRSGLLGLNLMKTDFQLPTFKSDSGSLLITLQNQRYIVSYDSLPDLNWKIINYTPVHEILNHITFVQTVLIMFIVFFIATILQNLFVTNGLVRRIGHLLSIMSSIRSGSLSARIVVDKRDEIGQIGLHFNKMLDYVQTLLQENYVIALREKDAQIRMLQAQINPHFLYNTLDTINWKAYSADSSVHEMIKSLGEILRYSINQPNGKVTLEEDIRQLEHYLYIQRIRYEERVEFITEIDPFTKDTWVYKLLIQPIVENAIQHGMENKEEGGIIRISSACRGEQLVIEVYDNGEGFSSESIRQIFSDAQSVLPELTRTHIGLRNVHQRLKQYYGEGCGLEIDSVKGEYSKVRLIMPIMKGEMAGD